VTPERTATRVCTAHEVWSVEAHGHMNIYPDAYVRETQGARRKWP
jgi:hypothetical protein